MPPTRPARDRRHVAPATSRRFWVTAAADEIIHRDDLVLSRRETALMSTACNDLAGTLREANVRARPHCARRRGGDGAGVCRRRNGKRSRPRRASCALRVRSCWPPTRKTWRRRRRAGCRAPWSTASRSTRNASKAWPRARGRRRCRDPVGQVIAEWDRPNGLKIARVRVPLGVIGIIYESRPNVTADAAALCLKSG